jgi:hypothetical protein
VLISSAGSYLPATQAPFDAVNPQGNYTIRTFPVETTLTDIAYAHEHYDHTAVDADLQVLLPLGHLAELVAGGKSGGLMSNVSASWATSPTSARCSTSSSPRYAPLCAPRAPRPRCSSPADPCAAMVARALEQAGVLGAHSGAPMTLMPRMKLSRCKPHTEALGMTRLLASGMDFSHRIYYLQHW